MLVLVGQQSDGLITRWVLGGKEVWGIRNLKEQEAVASVSTSLHIVPAPLGKIKVGSSRCIEET